MGPIAKTCNNNICNTMNSIVNNSIMNKTVNSNINISINTNTMNNITTIIINNIELPASTTPWSTTSIYLHRRRDTFSIAENFVKIFRSENVPERSLCQKPSRVVSVLHVGHRHRGVGHAVVDDGVDGHRHGVTSKHLRPARKRGKF